MARLTKEQWAEVKAIYALGQEPVLGIAERFGVSHTAINKKAKLEGWEKLENAIVAQAINSRAALKSEVSKVSKSMKLETLSVETEIERLATEKANLHEDMLEVRQMMLGAMRNKYDGGELSILDCKSGIEALAKEHETKFGKNPDTAIQINNQAAPTRIELIAP